VSALRYLASVVAGVAVTFAVVFTMQALIATAKAQLDESGARHFVDVVRVEREEILEKKERKAKRPDKPDVPPPDAPAPRVDSFDPVEVGVEMVAIPTRTDMTIP
jgi:protein TonB